MEDTSIPTCNAMSKYISESSSDITIEDSVFISHMSTDMACMSARIAFFAEQIKEKLTTIDGWFRAETKKSVSYNYCNITYVITYI